MLATLDVASVLAVSPWWLVSLVGSLVIVGR